MEDAAAAELGVVVRGGKEYDFFGVYDGHGGSGVAHACRDRLHRLLGVTDDKLNNNNYIDHLFVWAAQPDRADELDRIESSGGKVLNWNGHRVLGVLATSRSIGDQYLKPYVIAEPEVMVCKRVETDEFLILGSDGLWDVMSNEAACQVVRRCLSGRMRGSIVSENNDVIIAKQSRAAEAAAVLAELAIARGSRDNDFTNTGRICCHTALTPRVQSGGKIRSRADRSDGGHPRDGSGKGVCNYPVRSSKPQSKVSLSDKKPVAAPNASRLPWLTTRWERRR
nr:probable protein phosphatase 2C 51 [Ipomoea batatas]